MLEEYAEQADWICKWKPVTSLFSFFFFHMIYMHYIFFFFSEQNWDLKYDQLFQIMAWEANHVLLWLKYATMQDKIYSVLDLLVLNKYKFQVPF